MKRKEKHLRTRYPVEEGICRICQETTETDLLIKPCKCAGSIKYVHEVCLKTWILSRHIELGKAKCELCSSSFPMNFTIVTACNVKDALRSPRFLVFPSLAAGLLLLSFMLWGMKKTMDKASGNQKLIPVLLLGVCLTMFTILSVIAVVMVKKLCFCKKIKKWTIYDVSEGSTENDIFCEPLSTEFQESFEIQKEFTVNGVAVKPPDEVVFAKHYSCLLYTSPSPRDS